MLHICKADLGVEPSLPCQGLQYYSLLRCYPTSLSFCSQHSKMSSHMPLNSMCLLPDMLTETSFSTCTLPMTPPTLLQALLEGDSSPGREKERAWPCWAVWLWYVHSTWISSSWCLIVVKANFFCLIFQLLSKKWKKRTWKCSLEPLPRALVFLSHPHPDRWRTGLLVDRMLTFSLLLTVFGLSS